MRLSALRIGDPPERWEELGFAVSDGVCGLGSVSLVLGGGGTGIDALAIDGLDHAEIDGLATDAPSPAAPDAPHANGALAIDHFVVFSPDFDRTTHALAQAGITLSRIRNAGNFRQGFRRLGPAILELVEAPGAPPGPARFWGLVVIVEDLHVLARRLGDHLGEIKDAVQPGRHIATLRSSAGLGQAVAFMDPER